MPATHFMFLFVSPSFPSLVLSLSLSPYSLFLSPTHSHSMRTSLTHAFSHFSFLLDCHTKITLSPSPSLHFHPHSLTPTHFELLVDARMDQSLFIGDSLQSRFQLIFNPEISSCGLQHKSASVSNLESLLKKT